MYLYKVQSYREALQNSHVHVTIASYSKAPVIHMEDVMRSFICRSVTVWCKVAAPEGFAILRSLHSNPYISEKSVIIDMDDQSPEYIAELLQCSPYCADMITEVNHYCEPNCREVVSFDYSPDFDFQPTAVFSKLVVIEFHDERHCPWLPTLFRLSPNLQKVRVRCVEDAVL